MSKNTLLSELINYLSYDGSGKVSIANSLTVNNGSNGRIDVLPDYAQNYLVSYTPGAGSQSKLVVISAGISFRPSFGATIFMDVDSSGNVGVGGAANSSYNLYVTGTGRFTGALTGTTASFSSASTNPIVTLKNSDGDTEASFAISQGVGLYLNVYNTISTRALDFKIGGSSAVIVTNNRNVLIGTTADAGYKLDVSGTGRFTGALNIGNFDGLALKMQAGTSTGNSYLRFYNSAGGTRGYLGLFNSAGTDYLLLDGSSTDITINGSSNLYLQTAGANRITVNSSGIVGIGTTSPSGGISGTEAALEIFNTNVAVFALTSGAASGKKHQIYSSNDGGLYFRDGTSGSQRMVISTGGNVGIGTTSPNVKLEVLDTSTTSGEVARFQRNLDQINEYAYIKVGNASYPGYFGSMLSTYDIAYMSMSPNPTDGKAICIRTTDGNVGIGTISPSNKLQVSGNIYSTDTVFGRNLKPEAFVSVSAGTPSAAGIPLGYSSMTISITTDNNWRSILSNINDVKGYFWVTLGDAASKDTANYMMSMTSPAYGVSNFGAVSYQDNGWNTGGFEFTYDSVGGTYRLLVRCSSFYSGSGTAYGTIYFLRLE